MVFRSAIARYHPRVLLYGSDRNPLLVSMYNSPLVLATPPNKLLGAVGDLTAEFEGAAHGYEFMIGSGERYFVVAEQIGDLALAVLACPFGYFSSIADTSYLSSHATYDLAMRRVIADLDTGRAVPSALYTAGLLLAPSLEVLSLEAEDYLRVRRGAPRSWWGNR